MTPLFRIAITVLAIIAASMVAFAAYAATREVTTQAVYRGSSVVERPVTVDACKARAAALEEIAGSTATLACRVSYTYQRTTAVTGSATLSWQGVTEDTDGAPITVTGYLIEYGANCDARSNQIRIGNLTRYVIANLPAGTHCFSVRAIAGDTTSAPSNLATKTIQ